MNFGGKKKNFQGKKLHFWHFFFFSFNFWTFLIISKHCFLIKKCKNKIIRFWLQWERKEIISIIWFPIPRPKSLKQWKLWRNPISNLDWSPILLINADFDHFWKNTLRQNTFYEYEKYGHYFLNSFEFSR